MNIDWRDIVAVWAVVSAILMIICSRLQRRNEKADELSRKNFRGGNYDRTSHTGKR